MLLLRCVKIGAFGASCATTSFAYVYTDGPPWAIGRSSMMVDGPIRYPDCPVRFVTAWVTRGGPGLVLECLARSVGQSAL